MKIDIRHMEKGGGGIFIHALVSEIDRPLTPQYKPGDTEEEKEKKRKYWKEMLRIYDKKQKEIILLHLGEAELAQKEEEN